MPNSSRNPGSSSGNHKLATVVMHFATAVQELETGVSGKDMAELEASAAELQARLDEYAKVIQKPTEPPGKRDMTFEEKRRLSIALGNLAVRINVS